MAGSKTCNKCKKNNLGWDLDFHKRTKKWKLEDHRRGDGKWCNKAPEIRKMRTKKDLVLCELCMDSNFGLCLKDKLEEHIEMFHPNGEILTDLDYKLMWGLPKHHIQFWKKDKHYLKHYITVK